MAGIKKIGLAGYIGLVGIASVFDLFSLIPIAGDILAPIYWAGAAVYVWKKGYGFVNVRRLVTGGISMVAEMIPVVQEFPALLLGSIVLVFILKAQSKGLPIGTMSGKLGGKLGVKNVDGVRNPPRIEPLNRDGVRAPRNIDDRAVVE